MSKKLNNGFRDLRKNGYIAKQNFSCCQTCGWAEMPDWNNKVVFYHKQDNDDKVKGKPFHLAWSGDGQEICNILNRNGVETEWSGDKGQRILVKSW